MAVNIHHWKPRQVLLVVVGYVLLQTYWGYALGALLTIAGFLIATAVSDPRAFLLMILQGFEKWTTDPTVIAVGQILSPALYLAGVLVITGWFRKRWQQLLIAGTPSGRSPSLGSVLIAASLGVLLILAGFLLDGYAGEVFTLDWPHERRYIVSLGVIVFANALTVLGEEIEFRSFVFTVVSAKWGNTVGIVLSSVLFSSSHFAWEPLVLPRFVALLAMGFLFGYAFSRSRTLWIPVCIHYAWNVSNLAIEEKIRLLHPQVWPQYEAYSATWQMAGNTVLLALIGIIVARVWLAGHSEKGICSIDSPHQ